MFGDTIKEKNHIQVIFTSDPLGIMKPILSFVCWAPFLQTTHHVASHTTSRSEQCVQGLLFKRDKRPFNMATTWWHATINTRHIWIAQHSWLLGNIMETSVWLSMLFFFLLYHSGLCRHTVVSYQNESFSSKWELPCLPPSSLELWRRERESRQLSFWWKLILIGHYGSIRIFSPDTHYSRVHLLQKVGCLCQSSGEYFCQSHWLLQEKPSLVTSLELLKKSTYNETMKDGDLPQPTPAILELPKIHNVWAT